MNKRTIRIGVGVLVIVLAFSAIGSAAAQGPDRDPRGGRDMRTRIGRALIQGVLDALDLTAQDVRAQLREGKTLAEILTDSGIEPITVLESVKTALSDEIAQAVADGKITQEQADKLLERLAEMADRAMDRDLGRLIVDHPLAVRGLRILSDTLAEMADLETGDILSAVRDGKTLADIAIENGLDPDAVVQAALAATSETLQESVTNSAITQDQADKLLAQAQELYPKAMTAALPGLDSPIRDRGIEALGNSLIGVLAEAAGVEPRDLLRDALTLPSLADIAAEYGLDPDSLIATAEARITDEINQAVADGDITQEQADRALENLHARLVERFNNSLRLGPRFGEHPAGIIG